MSFGDEPDSSRDEGSTALVVQAPEPDALIDAPQRDLLCALGYVYLACGEPARALALLSLVERDAPEDVGALRVLVYAHIAVGDGERAIELLDRLDDLDDDPDSRTPLLLLRSHALRLVGRWDDARTCFGRFVTARNRGAA